MVYVWPLLEYASTTWSPSYIAQILQLESVQRTYKTPTGHARDPGELSNFKLNYGRPPLHGQVILCKSYNKS